MTPEEYVQHIAEWDSVRLNRLKSPDGWLNLAGLFWLREGENTVGSDVNNDIVFPRGPERLGSMILEDGTVTFTAAGDNDIKADGERFSGKITIYGPEANAGSLTIDSLGFFVIRRGERTGIRLRDYIHPRLALPCIGRYPADQRWIIRARFVEPEEKITLQVTDVLGDMSEQEVPGILEFNLGGATRRLYPTLSGESLFIVFADDTNGHETYGGGRFLSASLPDEKGYVYLDFNKAYNPPCALSPYATCPTPPRENFLPLGIAAGEKTVRTGW